MDDELFDELLDSVREAGRVLRGEQAPSRSFTLEPPDVRSPDHVLGMLDLPAGA